MKRPGYIAALSACLIFAALPFLVAEDYPWALLVFPPAALLGLYALLSLHSFLILTVFLVPLSVQLRFIIPETTSDIFLPTEMMLALILLLMIFKTIRKELPVRLIRHPVTIILFLSLAWYLITSLTGSMPLVSLKSFITRLWFICGFYLLAADMFADESNIRRYFMAYLAGMLPVALYFVVKMMISGGFNQDAAYASSRPFFNDHTSFGAALAFCIPVILYFAFDGSRKLATRLSGFILLMVFGAAFLLSYSRAAWISLALSLVFGMLLLFRVKMKYIFVTFVTIIAAVLISWQPLVQSLEANRQDSSKEISRHIRSITNITTDASNLERINRWKCAVKMFGERPLFGWGPATYQFVYAPFQMAADKTIISTNYGEGGNAHSEYLGALSESGLPGLLLWLALLAAVLATGAVVLKNVTGKNTRLLVIALLTGFMTYVIHGALNNFLDTDKLSALFWGAAAAVVALYFTVNRPLPGTSDNKVRGNDRHVVE